MIAALVCAAVFILAASTNVSGAEGVSVCGTLTAFTPATADRAGSATIGSRTLTLAPDSLYSVMGQNRLAFIVGRNICVNGGPGGGGPLEQYVALAMPSQYCGQILDYRAPTAGTDGSVTVRDTGIATFGIAPGAEMRDDLSGKPDAQAPAYKCFSLAIDERGDVYVTGRVVRPVDLIVSRFHACGRVTTYEKATPSTSGRIGIGSRSWTIERGFVYEGDPAGKQADRTVVGKSVCVSGSLTAAGELNNYITSSFVDRTCGQVSRLQPATSARAGSISFSAGGNAEYARYVIPAGKELSTAIGSYLCIRSEVAQDGDAAVVAVTHPEPLRLGGGAGAGSIDATPTPLAEVALKDLPSQGVPAVGGTTGIATSLGVLALVAALGASAVLWRVRRP